MGLVHEGHPPRPLMSFEQQDAHAECPFSHFHQQNHAPTNTHHQDHKMNRKKCLGIVMGWISNLEEWLNVVEVAHDQAQHST